MRQFKILSMLVILALVVISTGCEKDQDKHNNSPSISKSDKSMVAHIVDNYGFDKDDIIVATDFISVDGDMVFDKKNFWDNYGINNDNNVSDFKRHYKQNYLVTQITTIPVHVDGISSDWAIALGAAVDEWNSLNGDIEFYAISSSTWTSTGINIYNQDLGSDWDNFIAMASSVRSTGYPGNTIRVNTGYTGGSLSASEKKEAMVHELGHCIGFYHTDSGDGTKITDVSYWCRNFSNSSSVMQAVNSSWNGFSNCDEEAFDALY